MPPRPSSASSRYLPAISAPADALASDRDAIPIASLAPPLLRQGTRSGSAPPRPIGRDSGQRLWRWAGGCYIGAMPPELRDALAASICMNVRSFRKDGTPVDTPMWTVQIDGTAGCYTDDRTFKLKRFKRNPNVWIAASDVWGRCSTPFYPAVCHIRTDSDRRERT